MAEAIVSEDESANLPLLSPKELLIREKSRLEDSLSEISRTLREIEFHEKRNEMAENVFQPQALHESSREPFLGFTPKRYQSYQPGLIALAQGGVSDQIDRNEGNELRHQGMSTNALSRKALSSNVMSTNELVQNEFDANSTFSLGLGRGRLFATPPQLRKQLRFASAIHRDSDARSSEQVFDEREQLNDFSKSDNGNQLEYLDDDSEHSEDSDSLIISNQQSTGVSSKRKSLPVGERKSRDVQGSTKVELQYAPSNTTDYRSQRSVNFRQSTGLPQEREWDISSIGKEPVPVGGSNSRDVQGSTKVELQNAPSSTTDYRNQRSVHFRPNDGYSGQYGLGQLQNRPTLGSTFTQSTPYNSNPRQRLTSSNCALPSPTSNVGQPLSQQPSNSTDIMTRLIARQVIGKELPNFYGDPQDWLLFRSQYERTTATCLYTGEENIFRLRKCLKGDALTAVKSLLVSPNNSQAVMGILERRFGRPEDIIKSLIKEVTEAASPREDKPRSIVIYATVIQNLVATLEDLGRDDHLRNPMLLSELEKKLPTTLCLLWSEYIVDKQGVTMKTFSDWMQRRAEAASRRFTLDPVSFEPENSKKATKTKGFVNTVAKYVEPKSSAGNCRICSGSCQKPWQCAVLLNKNIEQRWNLIKEKKLCFSCLMTGHNANNCTRLYQCGIDGCQRNHNKVLHNKMKVEGKVEQQNNITLATVQSSHRTNLRILPVIVCFNGREVKTYALLDNGSQSTLITSSLVDRLGVTGISSPIILQWPNGEFSTENDSQIVNLSIRGIFNGAKTYSLIGAQTAKKLCLVQQTINREKLIAQWPYLRDVEFESFTDVRPEILIGENNCLLTVTRQLLHDTQNTPIASKTWLGWTISGNDGRKVPEMSVKMINVNTITDEDLHALVKSSMIINDCGINDQSTRSKEDERAQKILETTTHNIGGRWETGLLWRNPDVVLPESRMNAYHRLLNLEKKFDRDPELFDKYEAIINGYIDKGYLRKVDKTEGHDDRIWYLPHFPVKYPLKPGKIRVVFDAAAKSHGTSLNDNLVSGPDFLKLLSGVLFRFRQGTIGFIGDIKEMFHRVLINKSDVKCQKILWRGRERNNEPDEYEMAVMMFGATCSPSAAIYVKDLNAKRYENDYPEAVNAIINKHYMDDYLDSKFSVEEAVKVIKEVIFIHEQGSFEICNWVSSSKEVMAAIPENLRRKENSVVTLAHENIPGRVLGVLWKPDEDVFTFSGNFAKIDKELLDGNRVPTKREVLQIVSSIYDPLGFVAHFVITGRIIMKNIWKTKIGWDQPIPESINNDWQVFLGNLKNIGNVQIDRCYSPNLKCYDSLQLHIFGDSSSQAYCAIAFMRIEVSEKVEVKFITAKTRVTPLKEVTDENIHRLELQAALIVSRLSKFVLEEHELHFDDCYYWTDSMAVWYWIHSQTRRYKQFVANRLNEIWELTDQANWRWLPTQMNVSDDGTRFGSVEFVNSHRWYNGPDFLYEDQSQWPESNDARISNEVENWMEVVNVGQVVQVVEFALPQIERFSNWRRLIGATAWMLRYINNCNPNRNKIFSATLNVDEWTNAEMKWIRHSQQRSFTQEISDLLRKRLVHPNSRIYTLSPELDENGILRLCGRADRLPNSTIDQRRPIILDGQDSYARLLIRFYHEKYNHIGHDTVLNEIKQRFWIVKATVTLKKIRSECWKCKILKARPQPTIMGQLPAPRLEGGNPAFHFTGMDYFGPITIKIGRQLHKRYGVLFTCLTVRAVHIEVAASETTDSCIMAIRRFIARRGCPKEIYSDNGSNLRGANNELKAVLEALDQDKIRAAMTTHRIDWHFNPPTASHMGGSWERLVGSIKTAFYATLNSVHPTEEMLVTLLAEAEHVVNSRPLLELSNDSNEPETLTPNHFLIGRSSASAPISIFDKDDLILKKQWRASQHLADLFWIRWVKEYRPTLTKRTQWYRQGRNPQIGELVYMVDDKQPRGQWPRGIIANVFPGIDGQVRVVDVRTAKNTYRRPITKICLFDN
ncbi:uncharacterized protein LOC119066014 [Bradysia coprophila]|uniref:uncharacterized protein LOC119066014 n=1 Tax=Bradysia coprophila TaxID=38358 RepID=UPI00187D7446|nr:uncharacterized protein LOC119066014 [Bradysia coprophila]